MLKKSIPLLWAALLGGAMFTACDEQSEVSEYAHWKERNQEVIDALADSVRQNPDEWFALKAYDLTPDDEDNLSTTHRVNDYVYCRVMKSGDATTTPPVFTDSIRADYRMWLINGEVIDQSYRGETLDPAISVPAKFPMTGMITGWTTALQHMRVGDQWTVYIPYTLGYGTKGSGAIPGYSTLKYHIHLAGVYPTGTTVPGWQ